MKNFVTALFLSSAIGLLTVGCDGDSAEGIYRNIELQVAGYYANGGGALPQAQTGNTTTGLDLRQNGAQIEGYDNNGMIFRGTIGRASATEGSFTLNGQTTAGQDVTISGTISVPEGGTDATMTGTWLEPSLSAPLVAYATVPTNTVDDGSSDTNTVDNTGTDDTTTVDTLTISPTYKVLDISGGTVTESINPSGGETPYTFGINNASLGRFTEKNNSSATYEGYMGQTGTVYIFITSADNQTVQIQFDQE